ncbi:unnamed protein product, partial [Ectocarpus fasciculatus]
SGYGSVRAVPIFAQVRDMAHRSSTRSQGHATSGPLLPGSGRCLDAFAVALYQASDGKRWYTSTQQLQLASLGFCAACRSVSTLRVNVEPCTPRRLWAGVAITREAGSAKRRSVPRVPILRAREVAWDLPGSALEDINGDALSRVEHFAFSHEFNHDVSR